MRPWPASVTLVWPAAMRRAQSPSPPAGPENLQLTINNGISNTAATIRGTGTLNCT
jgi:hypothetical protein